MRSNKVCTRSGSFRTWKSRNALQVCLRILFLILDSNYMDSTWILQILQGKQESHDCVMCGCSLMIPLFSKVIPKSCLRGFPWPRNSYIHRDSRWRVCTLVGRAHVIFWVQFSIVSMSPTWRVVLRHWLFAHILSLCCLNKFESAWISETVQVKDWSSTSTQRRKSARWLQCSSMIWSAAHWAVVLRCKSKN